MRFLGEESTPEIRRAAIDSGKLLWVVDPLDGTANYVHGLSMYAVSIALVRGSDVQVGVVHDPVAGDTFTAIKDGPRAQQWATQSEHSCTKLDNAMVAASFPPACNARSGSRAILASSRQEPVGPSDWDQPH